MIIAVKPLVAPILCLLALFLLVFLGGWQWSRGLEKAEIERRYAVESEPRTLSARPGDWVPLDYRPVTLDGEWLGEQEFLLENRIYQGQPGYEVLTPFRLADDQSVILVNRGWIRSWNDGGAVAKWTEDPVGMLYRPTTGFTLGQTVSGELRWPQTVLYLDTEALSEHLGRRIEDAVLVLDPAHPAAFVRIWRPIALPASRHYGYAMQWWGLALALLVWSLIWYRRRTA